MKKIFTILLITCSFNTFAQYHPFIDENKLWVEQFNQFNNEDLTSDGETWRWTAYFDGDTIVDSVTFKKLFKQVYYYEHFPDINDSRHFVDNIWRNKELYKLVREDTTQQRIWSLDLGENISSEILIYDFLLNIGDTIIGETGLIFLVDSISTLNLNNGDSRRILYVSSGNDNGYFVEGVGGANGVLSMSHETIFDGGYSGEIICYSFDSTVLFGDCDLQTLYSNEKIEDELIVDVMPNPSDGIFKILYQDHINKYIVYDLFGNEISSKHNSEYVDLSSYSKGVYILQVNSQNNEFVKKIVKQ